MTIIDRGAKPRGRATPFDVSTIGAPSLPTNVEVFDVTSAPKSWEQSARHYDLRPGDRILVDWKRRPDAGTIGIVRDEGGGVRLIVFDGDQAGPIGRLVNPSKLLEVPAP